MAGSLIGDRQFYKRALAIALPIILQNTVTNFVSLVDNLMVGQLSTAQIAGVTIVNNNLLFIFNLCLFGAAAGAGIFTTQYFGSGDQDGVRNTFRFKLISCAVLCIAGMAVFLLAEDALIGLYLRGEGDPALAADTLYYAKQYLMWMLPGLIPFAVTNAYAGTLKVCGQATVPALASLCATVSNICLNYVFIFGNLGMPAMGIRGAALATVISRYIEMGIVVIWSHRNTEKLPFVKGLYRSFRIPGKLLRAIAVKGSPLLVNEAMWSFGMAFLNQCYSFCSLDVVPALSISATVFNMASICFKSLGVTVGIIMGQMLGANKPEKEIRDSNRKLTALCMLTGLILGSLMALSSGIFPRLYETTDSVRALATGFILIASTDVVFQSYIYPVYFTLRSGGKTVATFLFDCGSIWLLSLPTAFILSHYTHIHVLVIYGICMGLDLLKCIIGFFMMRSKSWIQNITVEN